MHTGGKGFGVSLRDSDAVVRGGDRNTAAMTPLTKSVYDCEDGKNNKSVCSCDVTSCDVTLCCVLCCDDDAADQECV
jgi:hypothetical protein